MGTKIICFLLGILFGFITIFGGIIVAAYFVKPGTFYPESDKFLGDLANMTFYQIYSDLSQLYKERLGIPDENGKYYTLGDLLERYSIDQVSAFGKQLPQDVLDIPIFEFFGGSMDNAMNQMRASVMFSLANFFTQTTDENGNVVGGYFGQTAIDKLSAHSMAELFDKSLGMSYVFAEVLFVDIMPSSFPAEEPETGAKMNWAFGQSSVGKLLGGMNKNLMLQFKSDGAFAPVGALTMKELFGSDNIYVKYMFGNKAFADMIDDNGNLVLDASMDGIYVGDLLDYVHKEVDVNNGYDKVVVSDVVKANDNGQYAKLDGEKWYQARLNCNDTSHDNAHTEDCYELLWYTEELTEADGMMGKLAYEKVSDLSNIEETIKGFTLKDVMGDTIPDGLKAIENATVGNLGTAIDNMYLGEFLSLVKKSVENDNDYTKILCDDVKQNANGEIIKKDGDNWYVANLNCTTDGHGDEDHTSYCYTYAWYDLKCETPDEHEDGHLDVCYSAAKGLTGRLSHLRMKELKAENIQKTISSTPLGEVMDLSKANGILKELADVTIGNLSNELDALYVGVAMSYSRNEVFVEKDDLGDAIYTNDTFKFSIYTDKSGNYYHHDERHNKYYEAKRYCEASTEGPHTHKKGCFGFMWYDCSNSLTDTDGTTHEHSEQCIVKGLNSKMANLTIAELSADGMTSISQSLTMGDLIESGMMEISADNEYKLDIIFDDCDRSNSDCNLALYLARGNGDAKSYYESIHGTDYEGRGKWKDLLLKDFIDRLLGAL